MKSLFTFVLLVMCVTFGFAADEKPTTAKGKAKEVVVAKTVKAVNANTAVVVKMYSIPKEYRKQGSPVVSTEVLTDNINGYKVIRYLDNDGHMVRSVLYVLKK